MPLPHLQKFQPIVVQKQQLVISHNGYVYFSKTNIRVNAIAPGFLLTKQNEALLLNEDGSYTARSEKLLMLRQWNVSVNRKNWCIIIPVSKEASSFVNGVVLPVDGGFNAYSGV